MGWGSTPPDGGAVVSMARLNGIVAGNGHSTTIPTTEVALGDDLADYTPNGGNVGLWSTFRGGSTSVLPDDDEYLDPGTINYSISHSGTGSKFTSKVLDNNNTGFGNMWLLDQLAGDDTITLSNRTKTTVQVNVSVYDGFGTNQLDDWDIRQKTVNGTLLEQFYGTQILGEGNFIISGEGDQ
mgnify:CR=1 FL=1